MLPTEKIIRIEFLVPFPAYDFTMKPDIKKTIHQLSLMWKTLSRVCLWTFLSQFETNISGFHVNWMLHEIDHEISAVHLDLALLRNETAMFLTPPQPAKFTRQRRGGASVGLAALAAVGHSGDGLAVDGSHSSGLRGNFGKCQDQSKANAENVHLLDDFQNSFFDYVTEFTTKTNEKFFLVENELATVNAIQSELAATQDKNWVIIQEQLAFYEQNFHILPDCDQLLFANQQLIFNFDTVSSLLSMIHASVKSYRSALFAFRMNFLNSFPVVLLKGYLPMSLFPLESVLAIMDIVSLRQSKAEDRLILAIPVSDLLSYYDSRLLADAITVSEGLLLTLNIPLASQQTVFTLFEAKLIQMPFPDDPQTALTWNIEAPYLPLSESELESSVLSEEQFEHCVGSPKYRICSEAFSTQLGHPSCIATLYFFSPIDALAVCETTAFTSTSIEQAMNFDFGMWLITSANADFIFR